MSRDTNELSDGRENIDTMQATNEGLSQAEKDRLEQDAARRRAAAEQREPTRVDLATFRRHPRVQKALATMSPEAAQQQMDEIDRQATRDIDMHRRQVRWEEYVNGPLGDGTIGARRYDYAGATIADLDPDGQDPQRRVSQWWRSPHRTLFLAGPADSGKTHAGHAITNTVAALDRDTCGAAPVTVRTYSVVELAAFLRFDAGDAKTRQAVLRDVTSCDLLLLDDLGREVVKDWWREQLFRILDARASDKRLRQIITANFSEKEKVWATMTHNVEAGGKGYGSPITSRVQQDCLAAWLTGRPHRTLATWSDPFEAKV